MRQGLPPWCALGVLLPCACWNEERPATSARPSAPPAEVVLAAELSLEAVKPASHVAPELDPVAHELSDAGIPWNDNAVLETLGRISETLNFTEYSPAIRVREADGDYRFDCSGMVDWVLARSRPRARAASRAGLSRRPLARDYQRVIARAPTDREQNGWLRIPRVVDVQPGDIVAWVKPTEIHSPYTGHVAFAVHSPVSVPGYDNAFFLRVADSTSLYHDDDSREEGGTTGFGFGTILLVTDESGAPIAYGWVGLRYRAFETDISLGRALR